jgi:hypothetical protein
MKAIKRLITLIGRGKSMNYTSIMCAVALLSQGFFILTILIQL